MHCPGGAVLPHTDRDDAAAAAGTRLHAFLQAATEVGRADALGQVDDDDERATFAAIDLDALPVGASYAAEVALAFDVTTGRVRELGRGLSRAEAYRTLTPTEIGGTADVLALAPDHALAADYKRGRSAPPATRNWQVRFLAMAAAKLWGRSTARAAVIQLAASSSPSWSVVDLDVFDLEEIADRMRELHSIVTAAAETVTSHEIVPHLRAGEWCRHCPAYLHCPVQTALVRRIATGAELDTMEMMLPLSKEIAGVAYGRLRQAEAMLARVRSAIYALAKREGPIPLGDGLVLGEREHRGNEVLDGKVAHAVITELFGGDLANEATEFTMTKAGLRRALRVHAAGQPTSADEKRALALIRQRGGAGRKPDTTRIEEFERDAND